MQYSSYRRSTPAQQESKWRLGRIFAVCAVLVLLGLATDHIMAKPAATKLVATATQTSSTKTKTTVKTPAPAVTQSAAPTTVKTSPPPPTACSGDTLSQEVIVSVGQRHLWACDGTTVSYDSAVVTGMENLAADLTPVGTYHIYGKQTNLYLAGSDSTGSWNDHVYYWMPWLSDQYGVYGFHDATWRQPTDFGNISPYSSNASHGCVELPLATAKWLYGWASIGTTVQIIS